MGNGEHLPNLRENQHRDDFISFIGRRDFQIPSSPSNINNNREKP